MQCCWSEWGMNGLCKKGVVLLAILTLYTLEKSTSVKLGAKEMERSPPPQSELKWFYIESHVSQLNLLLYHISMKSHMMNFTLWFSFFSGSRGNGIQQSKKAFTWEMKLSLYKKSLQNTISFSHSSSFSRTLGESWRLIWSSGELVIGTPWLLPVLYLELSFFPMFLFSVKELCYLSVQICCTFVQNPKLLFSWDEPRIRVSSKVHGDLWHPPPSRLLWKLKTV